MGKIIGIGNALVDIIVNLKNDNIINLFNLPRGGMKMINADTVKSLNNVINHLPKIMTSGGAASNTMHGLAHLGANAAYVGKIGKDHFGDYFKEDQEKNGLTATLIRSDIPTGVATTLITQDSERTFATYLGAACELKPEDIKPEMFQGYEMIHVEGYLIFNKELILTILKTAKEAELKISMDMASYNLVETNREFIQGLIKDYVDIIFANEDEAKAFSNQKNELVALDDLSQYCEIAIVKVGARGSMIKANGEITKISTSGVKAIDTNGAGDIYAAGFLYGLLNHKSIEECGKLGTVLSEKLICRVGAKLTDEDWTSLRKNELSGLL